MKLGAHMSTAGGLSKALERGAAAGCQIVQVFVKNNMQWFGRAPDAAELARFEEARRAHGFDCVFGHAGYLINLAAPAGAKRDLSIRSLAQELQFAERIGLPFLVLHPGAHLGTGEAAGLRQAAAGLDEVLSATPRSNVRIALEITAGQGTCLGHRVSHLAAIYQQCRRPERLAVCLDTAHLFAAGYDIRTPREWDGLMREVDSMLGLEQIAAVHLNDSKSGLGSRVDRHEHIGQGRIGLEGYRHIVNDPRLANRPGCLETPKSADLHEDIENLARLRSLLRRKGARRARRSSTGSAPRKASP